MKDILTSIFTGCLSTIIITIIYVILVGILFALVWNWIMPGIFNLPEITYVEALGIMLLSRMVFPGITIKNK